MDRKAWRQLVERQGREKKIQWSQHALERCLERGILIEDVEHCLLEGELIEFYRDAYPIPAGLLFHEQGGERLHVVVAVSDGQACHIITAYRPDSDHFESDGRRRKKH